MRVDFRPARPDWPETKGRRPPWRDRHAAGGGERGPRTREPSREGPEGRG